MTVEAARGAQVREAARSEERALADTLATAFGSDPVLSWLLPDEPARHARLRRFFTIELRHMGFARGAVWTCDRRLGAAICLPPGAWQLPPRVAIAQGPAFWRAFGRRLPLATGLQAAMEMAHERRPHWYILAVGVRLEHQGRGLGSALLAPTLERLGFRHVRELRFAGSPPLWLMLRAPRACGSAGAA